jgi:hypothetical protein
MVAVEDGLVYIALPGDPLRNFATVRHFFGEDFRVLDENIVLVQVGQIFDAHLKLHDGRYQTYHDVGGELVQWELLSVSWSGFVYELSISPELWCAKNPNTEHAYFPNECARILFERYFGIR